MIYSIHGGVRDVCRSRLVHRNLIEIGQIETHLRQRRTPYVAIERAIAGHGNALTIDDATYAGAVTAELACRLGHAVTFFINAYNVENGVDYFFVRLSAILDATSVESVEFEGARHALHAFPSRQQFRARVKASLLGLPSEEARQALVNELGTKLGVADARIPAELRTIKPIDLARLCRVGVSIGNHGWSHCFLPTLPVSTQVDEVSRGKDWILRHCSTAVTAFAAPFGEFSEAWPPPQLVDSCERWLSMRPGIATKRDGGRSPETSPHISMNTRIIARCAHPQLIPASPKAGN